MSDNEKSITINCGEGQYGTETIYVVIATEGKRQTVKLSLEDCCVDAHDQIDGMHHEDALFTVNYLPSIESMRELRDFLNYALKDD